MTCQLDIVESNTYKLHNQMHDDLSAMLAIQLALSYSQLN